MRLSLSALQQGLAAAGILFLAGGVAMAESRSAELAALAEHSFDDVCSAGMTSFGTTTHTLVTQNCSRCHNGSTAAPAFAVDDVQASYFTIQNYVNFSDLANSRIVERAGNGHCGCGMTADRMSASLSAWWEGGEKSCERNGRFFTDTMALPANLPPDGPAFVKMQWNLASLGTQFRNTTVEVEAQRFSDRTPNSSGAYRFRKPRVTTSDHDLHISDVKVLINRKYDALANAFTFVDQTVSPQMVQGMPATFPVLTARTLIAIQDQAEGDQISLSFNALDVATADQCTKLDEFTAKVLPAMAVRNCYACHGGGSTNAAGVAPANQLFPMNVPAEQLCRGMLQRIDKGDPTFSAIVAYPLKRANGHPKIFVSPGEVIPTWLDWMQNEIAD